MVSRRRCIDPPQESMVFTYRSTDHELWPPNMMKTRTYEPGASTFELTLIQEAPYPLPVNILSQDFDYTDREVSYKSRVEDPLNWRSGSAETSAGT